MSLPTTIRYHIISKKVPDSVDKKTAFKDRPEYTIPVTSHHPSADDAMAWFIKWRSTNPLKWAEIKEAIYSTALSGNETSNYCVGTIERLEAGAPVSDRYLLGLAWLVRRMDDGGEI